MDYSFFIKDIAVLATDLHKRLVDDFSLTPLDISRSYFNDVHTGFNSKTVTANYTQAPESVKLVIDALKIFKREQFWAYELNQLEPLGEILEHTDQSSTVISGHRVPMCHTVHIPLTGEGVYSFRRSLDLPFTHHKMEAEHCYLFNNYVLHKVKNGKLLRRNLMLHFYDPDWATKRSIYEKFNVKGLY